MASSGLPDSSGNSFVEYPRTIMEPKLTKAHGGLSLESVTISLDRLELICHQYEKSSEGKNAWRVPLSLFFSVVGTFLTTDFKDTFFFSADTWRAVFLIIAVGSLLWLIFAVIEACKSERIEDLIGKIKNQE